MYQSKQNWKTNDNENQAKQPHSMQCKFLTYLKAHPTAQYSAYVVNICTDSLTSNYIYIIPTSNLKPFSLTHTSKLMLSTLNIDERMF